MKETMESRIIKDENGFYKEQIRFVPYPEWDPCEGWRTIRYVDYTGRKEAQA